VISFFDDFHHNGALFVELLESDTFICIHRTNYQTTSSDLNRDTTSFSRCRSFKPMNFMVKTMKIWQQLKDQQLMISAKRGILQHLKDIKPAY
jgi:hypothetical protein